MSRVLRSMASLINQIHKNGIKRKRTLFTYSVCDITFCILIDIEEALSSTTRRVPKRIAVTAVKCPLKDASIPSVYEV